MADDRTELRGDDGETFPAHRDECLALAGLLGALDHTGFSSCEIHVTIRDLETEVLYGWALLRDGSYIYVPHRPRDDADG